MSVRRGRQAAGRNAVPFAVAIDREGAKATESGIPRGFDAAERVKGRKRRIVADSYRFLLVLLAHASNIQDNHGTVALLAALHGSFPNLQRILADRVYPGTMHGSPKQTT